MDEMILESVKIFKQNGIMWPELSSAGRFYNKIKKQLQAQQDGNRLGVEDIVNQLLYDVCVNGRYAALGACIKHILTNKGILKTKDSPKFVPLNTLSNDDDLQGEEDVRNDLSVVASPDSGPGSDMHIACLDIEEQLGERALDVFECRLTGAMRTEVSEALGYTYTEVRYSEKVVAEFLERGQYTLDGSNRRLGSAKEFQAGKTFFPAERRTVRMWELPDVDHRGTSYVDPVIVDNTPLRPIGEIVITTDILYSDSTGSVETKVDDRNTTPGVVTERCKKLPGFCMNGHTIKDCSRKSVSAVGNSDYNFFSYCDELYDSTVRTREYLL